MNTPYSLAQPQVFSLVPTISLTQFLINAKEHRANTTFVIDGQVIDEFGRNVTGKKPISYMPGSPVKFAPHLHTVSNIVKEIQTKRDTFDDWSAPGKTLDNMRFKLTEALEHLVCDFDYENNKESNPANTVRILAQTLLTINDFFDACTSNCSEGVNHE